MSLALSAIVLYLLFIVPPLFFYRTYYSSEFSNQYFKSSPFELFLSSIIPGILFQCVYYWIVTGTRYQVDFKVLGTLIAGSEKKEEVEAAFSSLKIDLPLIFYYNVSLWIILAIAGLATKFVVRKFKIDRTYGLFRYKNHWHYLLSGEILDFPNIEGEERNIDFTWVNVLVNVNSSIYLYSGVLEHYQLTSQGSGLDYILLSSTEREVLSESGSPQGTPLQFAGDFFTIPFSSIVNINFHYIAISEPEPPQPQQQQQQTNQPG